MYSGVAALCLVVRHHSRTVVEVFVPSSRIMSLQKSVVNWNREYFLSQVDVDDAEDFKLTDIQKEFRFLPPVDNTKVEEYQKARVPPATRKATRWGVTVWKEVQVGSTLRLSESGSSETVECNTASKDSIVESSPVTINVVKENTKIQITF